MLCRRRIRCVSERLECPLDLFVLLEDYLIHDVVFMIQYFGVGLEVVFLNARF